MSREYYTQDKNLMKHRKTLEHQLEKDYKGALRLGFTKRLIEITLKTTGNDYREILKDVEVK